MEKEIGDYLDTFYDVRCTNDECYLEGGADWVFGTKEEVIEKWNTRHEDPRINELEGILENTQDDNVEKERRIAELEVVDMHFDDIAEEYFIANRRIADLEAELTKYKEWYESLMQTKTVSSGYYKCGHCGGPVAKSLCCAWCDSDNPDCLLLDQKEREE